MQSIKDFSFDELSPGRLPGVAAVVHQLGGGQFTQIGEGGPLITWPMDDDKGYEFPHTSHVDGYGTRWMPFMLGLTTYLYDVEERGGGFGYWPGSHLTTHALVSISVGRF